MTKRTGNDKVNAGPTPKATQAERDAEHDGISGNAAVRGEPSPGDRDRGETTSRESGGVAMPGMPPPAQGFGPPARDLAGVGD